MTDLELIFTMLGEASTTEIATRRDARGFEQNKIAANAGGAVAGNARKELETKSGKPVISGTNFLTMPEASSSAIAVSAFVATQTDALALSAALKPATRKRVAAKTANTIAERGGAPSDVGSKKRSKKK